MRALPVALAVALVAGCIGEEPVESAAPAPPAQGSTESAGFAGNATDAPPPPPVDVDASFDGETGTWACAGANGDRACHGEFSASAQRDLLAKGAPVRVAGTVHWNATVPTELRVAIFLRNGTDIEYADDAPRVAGASPLAFDFDLAAFAGREIVIDVGGARELTESPVGLTASHAQAFRLVGTLTYQPTL